LKQIKQQNVSPLEPFELFERLEHSFLKQIQQGKRLAA